MHACHCMTVLGHAVLCELKGTTQKHCFGEDFSEAVAPQVQGLTAVSTPQ